MLGSILIRSEISDACASEIFVSSGSSATSLTRERVESRQDEFSPGRLNMPRRKLDVAIAR